MPQRTRESYVEAGKRGAKSRWSGPQGLTIQERFWIKVRIGTEAACWPWKSAKRNEYGRCRFLKRKLTTAPRVAYELTHGPIPEGMHVCHRCDFRPCCNPAHLFLGTAKQNLDDAIKKGRMAIGHRHGNAKLADAQVKDILKLCKNGTPQSQLARQYGVSQSIISDINRGVSWKHIKRSGSARNGSLQP